MNKKDKEKFKKFGEVVKFLEENPLPDSHWIKMNENMRKRIEKNKRINDAIKMSPEKFRQPFDL